MSSILSLQYAKEHRLLFAAVDINHVSTLKKVLSGLPELCQITNSRGNSLLQEAILNKKKEAFDYLLSLENIPLENRNRDKETALVITLTQGRYRREGEESLEYYALELIKKGVQVHKLALHQAVNNNLIEVAKLLLHQGFDPNTFSPKEGTPFHLLLRDYGVDLEFVALLLSYGVDPLIESDYSGFELAINKLADSHLLEHLCLYTLDEDTSVKIHLFPLLRFAEKQSPFFRLVVDHIDQIIISTTSCIEYYLALDCDKMYLDILIERCGLLNILVIILSNDMRGQNFETFTISTESSIESLVYCVETTLGENIVDFVATIDSTVLLTPLYGIRLKESVLTELFCFLLSYGLELTEMDLQIIYQIYGYCELFKILLHMDIKLDEKSWVSFSESATPFWVHSNILPIFIYNVTLNLGTYLENAYRYSVKNVGELLNYFANPELKQFCKSLDYDKNVEAKLKDLPDVPLLEQLARDAFRKFVVDKYEMKTSKEFYTYINGLPFSEVLKKVITFETKLY